MIMIILASKFQVEFWRKNHINCPHFQFDFFLCKNFLISKLIVLGEMSLYIGCSIPITISFLHTVFFSYEPAKVLRIDVVHPVYFAGPTALRSKKYDPV